MPATGSRAAGLVHAAGVVTALVARPRVDACALAAGQGATLFALTAAALHVLVAPRALRRPGLGRRHRRPAE
ncbi:MAG: hypothetical protein U1F43_10150 [Myxococcota bacterium]